MTKIIQDLVGNDLIATLIMSFVPLIELKGGIVFARGAGFDFLYAFLFAYLGSTLVLFPIYFLFRPLLDLIKKVKFISRLAFKIEGYFDEKAKQTMEKHKNSASEGDINKIKKLAIFVFVAIPLPMTGIWSGTAIAVFFNLKFKDAILPLMVGNLVAGIIISILAQVCISLWTIEAVDYILYSLFAIALILIVAIIIKLIKSKPKKQEEGE